MSINSMTTHEQIESFYRFATDQLTQGRTNLTLDELYDEWRLANPTLEESTENLAAIQAALGDLEAGVKPIPFDKFTQEFRERNGIDHQR